MEYKIIKFLIKENINLKHKVILVTGHCRENHGFGFVRICQVLKEIALTNEDILVIYPVHLYPKVKKIVFEILNNIPNIEEVPSLGKFVLQQKGQKLLRQGLLYSRG